MVDLLLRVALRPFEPLMAWLITAALFLIALILRLQMVDLEPLGRYPFLTFIPAAMAATLLCGRVPGVACAVAGGLSGLGFLHASGPGLRWLAGDLYGLLAYAVAALLAVLVTEALTVAVRRANAG